MEEAIHRRHLTTTLVTQPLPQEKAINKITQNNKHNNKTKHEASVRDYDHSRKRLRGVKRKQQRDRPTTVAERKSSHKRVKNNNRGSRNNRKRKRHQQCTST